MALAFAIREMMRLTKAIQQEQGATPAAAMAALDQAVAPVRPEEHQMFNALVEALAAALRAGLVWLALVAAVVLAGVELQTLAVPEIRVARQTLQTTMLCR